MLSILLLRPLSVGAVCLLDHHVRVGALCGGGLDHAGGPVVVDLLALTHHALAGAVGGVSRAVVPAADPATLVLACRVCSVAPCRSRRRLVLLAVPVTARGPEVCRVVTLPGGAGVLLSPHTVSLQLVSCLLGRAVLGLLQVTVGQLQHQR